jgi:copper homeostasis protein
MATTEPILIEACIDSVESAMAAERGGAGRVELCADLHDAGTTPSAGMIAACAERLAIPVFVIVRPRGGNFVASDAELDVMRRDARALRGLGARGVVLGLLTPDGEIDIERMRMLIDDAGGLAVTFHRAFDHTRDLAASLDALGSLGVARVLTSGGAATALEGAESIAARVRLRKPLPRDEWTREETDETRVRGIVRAALGHPPSAPGPLGRAPDAGQG